MLSVCAPNVPQLRLGRPDLPGSMPPHPCVHVAVDERQVVPDPVKPPLTCRLTFQPLRSFVPIVDLGRPGDDLDNPARPAPRPRLGRERTWSSMSAIGGRAAW